MNVIQISLLDVHACAPSHWVKCLVLLLSCHAQDTHLRYKHSNQAPITSK